MHPGEKPREFVSGIGPCPSQAAHTCAFAFTRWRAQDGYIADLQTKPPPVDDP